MRRGLGRGASWRDMESYSTRIERDYGSGNLQVAYAYGYNSDGVRVWKRDGLAGREYRYVCRIGCGSVPMRVYSRAIGGESWNTLEEYVAGLSSVWYRTGAESAQDYGWLAGHWLSGLTPPPAGAMLYQDWFGVRVGGTFESTDESAYLPKYLEEVRDLPYLYIGESEYVPMGIGVGACVVACACGAFCLYYLLSCISDCQRSMNPFECARVCLESLPGWVQFLCGACLSACLFCIQRNLCRPSVIVDCTLHCLGRGLIGYCVFGKCVCLPIRFFPRPIPKPIL